MINVYGKGYYVITYKGEVVYEYGKFRSKQTARDVIHDRVPKWERKDYNIVGILE